MKAIILAAGRGSRMNELTAECPKCLMQLHGKPILEWQLEALHKGGVSEIAIVTGYKRELLASKGLAEFHNPRWAESNMVTSLEYASEWLTTAPCIVSYSDIFYGHDAVRSLVNCNAPLAITFDPNWLDLWKKRFGDPLLDAETFRVGANNMLIEIGNKPYSLDEVQGQYMGLLRFTPKGWNEVARVRADMASTERDAMHMTGTLQKVIDAGRLSVLAVPYAGVWGEVDTTRDLETYRSATLSALG